MPRLSSFTLRMAAFLICAHTGGAAQADTARAIDAIATRNDISTSTGHKIPAGAFGFLVIQRPREITLLNLRGIGGSGQVILRTDEPGMCLTFPIRFVAGDFGGDSISGHLADSIQFIIKSRQVARALAKGRDVVSDEYSVSAQMDADANIVLQSGLDESFSFVINPGRNILGDIFGVRTLNVSCQRI